VPLLNAPWPAGSWKASYMRLKARFNSLREHHFQKGERMRVAICVECEEEYPIKRQPIGYRTCLDCGERSAVGLAS